MRRAVWLALALPVLLVAGCGGPPESPQESACAQESYSDPTVKDLIMKGAGSEHFQRENQDVLAFARKAAIVRCLKARGIVPPGGVEAQRPLK